MNPWLASLHMGALHPVEQALVYLLAFGPFVVLGLVIAVRRHREAGDDQPHHQPQDQPDDQLER